MDINQWDQVGPQAEATISLEAMDQLVIDYRKARDAYDAAKKVSSELSAKADEAEEKVLAALKSAKRSKYEVDGVGLVFIREVEQYTTPKTILAKTALFNYIKEKHGPDALMGLVSINSQTLNSWANREAEEGVMQIPGLEAPTVREGLNLRRK
jgi:hypothetical protein